MKRHGGITFSSVPACNSRMVKFCFICVLVMCVLEADALIPFTAVQCARMPPCPLYHARSDIVTVHDLRHKVDGTVWIPMYYTEFVPNQTYGKCTLLWNHPNKYHVVRRQTVCYNFVQRNCQDLGVNVTRTELACGRAAETGVNSVMDARFYSQDITNYFWYDQCYQYNFAHECTVRYLTLMVKESRIQRTPLHEELDLQGLPWDLIAADLKNNFDLTFSDPHVKFNHLEPECGLDGRVIGKPHHQYQHQLNQNQPYQHQPFQQQPYQFQSHQYPPYQYRRNFKNKHFNLGK